jgi:hypothetical protein
MSPGGRLYFSDVIRKKEKKTTFPEFKLHPLQEKAADFPKIHLPVISKSGQAPRLFLTSQTGKDAPP